MKKYLLFRLRIIVTVPIISAMTPCWHQNLTKLQNVQKPQPCFCPSAAVGQWSQQFLDFTHFRRDCLGPLDTRLSVYFQYCDMLISVKVLLERIQSVLDCSCYTHRVLKIKNVLIKSLCWVFIVLAKSWMA